MRIEQIIRGNDVVQKHVAAKRQKESFLVVSPLARLAITREVVPQLEANLLDQKMIPSLRDGAKTTIESSFPVEKSDLHTLGELQIH